MRFRATTTPILALITLAACASTTARPGSSFPEARLVSVERPADASSRYGSVQITRIDSAGWGKYAFEDSLVRATFLFGRFGIGIDLRNKSSSSMRLPWDDVVYVDTAGQSHRVIHTGVRLMERDKPQAPSVIARGMSLADGLYPTDYIRYDPTASWMPGWKQDPLFRGPVPVGSKVQITLPLEVQGKVNEYVFLFEFTAPHSTEAAPQP